MFSERVFEVNGYRLTAKEWHTGQAIPVLALHGWLDNANSFDTLAALLPDCHIIALDMPGHGHSDHKSPQASYNIWDDLLDVLAVADKMGWQQFHLLGHSRGAIMTALLAAASPEKIITATMLDAIFPQAVDASEAALQLGKYLRDSRSVHKKKLPKYQSADDAVAARCRHGAMSEDSAKAIVERGLKEEQGSYRWTSDPRLTGASAFKMTSGHIDAVVEALTMPCLLLMASRGLGGSEAFIESLNKYQHLSHEVLQGSHHFHMEQPAAGEIAARLKKHFVVV